MSDLTISLGAGAPIELALLALGLIHARGPDGTIRDEPIPGNDLEVKTRGTSTRIESLAPSFRIHNDDGYVDRAWFLPLNPSPVPEERSRSSRLRVGIAGGSDTRRLKMAWRTLGELRRRDVAVTPIVAGECELSAVADERPFELHGSLAPAEYLALLDRLDVVLECTDSFGTESFLAVAARDRGVPVVAHRDRAGLALVPGCCAGMWSADGFVDALIGTKHERGESRASTESLDAILELIERR